MKNKVTNHWELLKEMDPHLSETIVKWRSEVESNPLIPAKYQELMRVAMGCVLRFTPAVKTHAALAIKAGATKDEVFATLMIAMLMGGVPSFREAGTALCDLFNEE
jgi:alkylhydroperoxidase/carboxymuconolactone decarboxylase family protein YurZ